MVQNVGLNQAQMDFLRLLSHFNTEEQVKELNDLVCQYYARKVDEEMDRLWDEGKWNQEKIEETLKEHLRTPYNVWKEKNSIRYELSYRCIVANATYIVSDDKHFDVLKDISFPQLLVLKLKEFLGQLQSENNNV